MQSKLLRQYYQIDIINMKHFLILIMLCFTLPLAAQNHKYHRVGVSSGTYGHSMQKKECPYCGKMISLGSSHTCVTNEEPRSNAPASDNSYDGPASAIDGDLLGMDLLLHKTGYYPQRVQQQATPKRKSEILKIIQATWTKAILNAKRNGNVNRLPMQKKMLPVTTMWHKALKSQTRPTFLYHIPNSTSHIIALFTTFWHGLLNTLVLPYS